MGKQSSNPEVTVVITAMTDSERPWLLEAVDSVLAQTVVPHELILCVAEGNSWITEELARSAHPVACEKLVKLHRMPMALVGAVRNAGIKKASTSWVAFLDSDDAWDSRKLEKQLQAAYENPDASFIGTDYVFIDAQGRSFGFADGSNPTPSSWMVRRDLMLAHPFDPEAKQGEDYFWLVDTYKVSQRVRVPEVLVHYRIRGRSISALEYGQSSQRRLRERAAQLAAYPFVRYPLLATTYVRYLIRRRTTYDV